MKCLSILFAMLLLAAPAWAGQHPCAICSVEQARLHLEECELSQEWQEETYFFCAQGCLDRFKQDPASWAERLLALQVKTDRVPDTLPAFKLPLEPVGSVSSQDVEGRVLVLNYWASWCAPCMNEMPELVKLQEELGPRGVSVLGFNYDETAERHRRTVKQLELNFPSFFANDPQVKEFLDKLGPADLLPTTYLVDTQGKILQRLQRATTLEELRTLIEPHLPKEEGDEVGQAQTQGSVVPS